MKAARITDNPDEATHAYLVPNKAYYAVAPTTEAARLAFQKELFAPVALEAVREVVQPKTRKHVGKYKGHNDAAKLLEKTLHRKRYNQATLKGVTLAVERIVNRELKRRL